METPMTAQEVGGLVDTLGNLIKGWIADALAAGSAFDFKKFMGHAQTRQAVACLATAAKDSAKLPMDIDDKIIDQAVLVIDGLLDQYKNLGPVKVGASGESAVPHAVEKRHSKQEVEEALKSVGIDPITISMLIISLLQYAPNLIAMIKKLFNK